MNQLSRQEREYREKMRGRYSSDPKWYAVMTHCGRERQIRDLIAVELCGDGVEETVLPEIKPPGKSAGNKRNLPKLLFSSYVFIRCKMSDAIYIEVNDYDGVLQILGRAYRIPVAIEDAEITHLKGVLASPKPKLAPRLNIGAEAVVTHGLMQGMRGRVIEINDRYAKIEVYFSFLDMGTSVVVAVPRERIEIDASGWREMSSAMPPEQIRA